jgi:hypothetical protein
MERRQLVSALRRQYEREVAALGGDEALLGHLLQSLALKM